MKHFSLYVILYFVACQSIYAIHPIVRNFSRYTYKAGTQNWSITQSDNNCMYFGNNNGLLEFDGLKWTTYPILNRTNVRSVYYDNETMRIYCGASGEFGYYIQNNNGLLNYRSLLSKIAEKDRNFSEIWKIHKTAQAVYFQGDNEIFCFSQDTVLKYPVKNKIDCSALIYNSLIIGSAPDGVMTLSGNILIKLPQSEIMKDKRIRAILPYKDHKILFITDFYGMYIFDGEKTEPFKTDIDEFIKNNQVFCATTNGKQIAIGTVGKGVIIGDLETLEYSYVNTFHGLQNNTVLSIAYDKLGNLWLGLDKGIDYVLTNSPITELFGSNNLYGAGYASLLKDNILYLGTNQGLYCTTFPLQSTPFPEQLERIKNMQGQVWCLTNIDNTLVCGNDKGAFIIHGKQAEQIPNITGTWNFKLLKKHPGYILGCSYQGLFLLKKVRNQWQFSHFLKGFNQTSGMFEEDEDGKIWFSHWIKGISRITLNESCDIIIRNEPYDTQKGFPTNRNNTLYKIGNKIIFSSENGFYQYNPKTNRMDPDLKMNSIFDKPVNSMRVYESPEKNLYCVSGSFFGSALYQQNGNYELDSLTYRYLQNKLIVGFENLNFIQKDQLLISTEDGFSWINTHKISTNTYKHNVFIKNVYTTNEKDSLVSSQRAGSSKNENQHTFSFKDNSLRFEFSSPEYRSEDAVTYSYFLENYDTDWSDYTPANSKEYTKLKKGTYIFHVKAKNAFENEIVENSYKFTILPPWYQSILAQIIYLIIIILFIIGSILMIKKLNRKKELAMEVQKENELREQEKKYQADAKEKEKEIIELKNQRLQYNLRHKSQELASSTMNLIRKNEILLEVNNQLNKISEAINSKEAPHKVISSLSKIQMDIKQNIEHDNDWKKFEQNFDLVYEDYLKRLSEQFPQLNISDKKLCAYLKMDLSSKDIAPLLNMSVRSVEMTRYRLRKKMNLERDINLSEFLQSL